MFYKNVHIRMNILLLLFFFCFVLIIGKVFYIEVISYNKLSSLANDLWSRNIPVEPDRGKIYDRKGNVLVDNVTTSSLYVIPNQIKDKEKTSKLLSSILNTSYEKIYEHVSKKSSIEKIHPEGRRLSYDIADKINNLNIEGLYLVKESKRLYPYDNLLSHTLGFVGIDNQGLSGLELTYDKYLTGERGAVKYYSDAKGGNLNLNEAYEAPLDGMNVELTIDKDIQISLERELNNAMSKYKADQALGIVIDPNSGEILALSGKPDYSPSNYQKYSTELINRNLPVWMTYEPGSTFKNVTPLFSNFILKL